jgi:hypothetical protein
MSYIQRLHLLGHQFLPSSWKPSPLPGRHVLRVSIQPTKKSIFLQTCNHQLCNYKVSTYKYIPSSLSERILFPENFPDILTPKCFTQGLEYFIQITKLLSCYVPHDFGCRLVYILPPLLITSYDTGYIQHTSSIFLLLFGNGPIIPVMFMKHRPLPSDYNRLCHDLAIYQHTRLTGSIQSFTPNKCTLDFRVI